MGDLEAELREKLVWALRWIAAEPKAALAALRFEDGSGALPADEIALALEDWWLPIRENGLVSDEIRQVVADLDDGFEAISGPGNDHRWTDDAVRSDPVWQAQRVKARAALQLLSESRDDANIFGHV